MRKSILKFTNYIDRLVTLSGFAVKCVVAGLLLSYFNIHIAVIIVFVVLYSLAKYFSLEKTERSAKFVLAKQIVSCLFFVWVGHNYTQEISEHIYAAQSTADDARYETRHFQSNAESKFSDLESKLDDLESEVENLRSQIRWR